MDLDVNIDAGDLENLTALTKELDAARVAVDALVEAKEVLGEWARGLGERWEASSWGTAALDEAVKDLADSTGDLAWMAEAIQAAEDAVRDAGEFADQASEVGVRGDLGAFTDDAA